MGWSAGVRKRRAFASKAAQASASLSSKTSALARAFSRVKTFISLAATMNMTAAMARKPTSSASTTVPPTCAPPPASA